MNRYLYHLTRIENINSILEKGLLPSFGCGAMENKDGLIYFTNSFKYMKIIANDIMGIKEYAILKVNVPDYKIAPIWWNGKKYHEYVTKLKILPEDIKLLKIIRAV